MELKSKKACIAYLVGCLIMMSVSLWGFINAPEIDSGFDIFMVIFIALVFILGCLGTCVALETLKEYKGDKT